MPRAWTLSEAIIYGRGVERDFLCPVHGDSSPSAQVNVIKGVWHCKTCGAHGGITGEDALVEPDYVQVKEYLNEQLEAQRVYPESWLNRFDAGPVHPYWAERVGEEAARAFRLGYDPDNDVLTYPLRSPTGSVLGVVWRRLPDGDGPKYRYPKGVNSSRLLFNYDGVSRPAVVLVEGALDAVALHRVGVHALAIFGAHISKDQVALIDRVAPSVVVCAFDRDKAGAEAWTEARAALGHYRLERMIWPSEWGKDVDEIGLDHLSNVVADLASADLVQLSSTHG